ncbi:MAG TPA: immunity 53 family protein [Arachidicoccus sp.]|nr:immunity 53 family protein [Arachidicoccus sp.]
MEIIKWLEKWYRQQCDGEWEHEYTVHIETLGNPGWSVKISVMYTDLENVQLEVDDTERSEDDWFFYRIKDGEYFATGDPDKLQFLLEKFKEIAEQHDQSRS